MNQDRLEDYLKDYNRKRDFNATPEPPGEAGANHEGLRFVIQKHDASSLHYDFRLEIDGVLKSWAVPKGPSIKVGEKRLAVETEDHPLSYGDFEGVIPSGHYGAGPVIIWDTGTWRCDGDPLDQYRRGKIPFELDGERLHGKWNLVRTRGKDSRQWLLIKGHDSADTPSVAPRPGTEETSAVSGATFDSLQAEDEAPREGQSRRRKSATDWSKKLPRAARKADMQTIKAQLPELVSRLPKGDDWLHEIKLDGYRILAHKQADDIELQTRNGNDWTDRFHALVDPIRDLPCHDCIVDGEVVVYDRNGATDFQALQNALKERQVQLHYVVFDLLHLDGHDLREARLEDRRALLRELMAKLPSHAPLQFSDAVEGQGDRVLEHACNMGVEGIVSKRRGSSYRPGRHHEWVKAKCLHNDEFVIGGFSAPQGGRTDFGSLLLGYFENGKFVYCGRVGTGFTDSQLKDMGQRLQARIRDDSPFDGSSHPERDSQTPVTWVEPEVVIQVAYGEWTRDGRLRHPAFKGLREDKPARDVGRPTPADPPEVQAETGSRKTGTTASKGRSGKTSSRGSGGKSAAGKAKASSGRPPAVNRGRDERQRIADDVRLTHPDKVLFEDAGVTKQGLVDYYVAVAEWLLPHISRRPLSVLRCTQGAGGDCFLQKHPKQTFNEPVHRGKIDGEECLYVDDVAGLAGLVQMDVLELHPWGSTLDDLEHPDSITFDLDPGPGIEWTQMIEGARLVREVLESLDFQCFVKLTGSKGLHVVVPLRPSADWDQVKTFAKRLAKTLERHYPDRFVATATKSKRKDRIFLDYLRNGRGATSVACFSTRARPHAPVATPIRWNELSPRTGPDHYRVDNLPARLKRLRKDPWEGYFDLDQRIEQMHLDAIEKVG